MTKGFTLVEILIVLAVFGIIMVAGSDFLIRVVRNANTATIQNEVRQNASAILQDITRTARSAYCIYYDSTNIILRLSDDPSGSLCNTGNRTEYQQDVATPYAVKKRTIDSSGVATPWVNLSPATVAVLNCTSSTEAACGQTVTSLCTAGLDASLSPNPATNGVPVTIKIYAQQQPSQTRSDLCAAVKLTDTITPRIK